MTTEPRRQHPYHMHEAIWSQPEAFADSAARGLEAGDSLAARLAACRRVDGPRCPRPAVGGGQ